MGAYLVDNPPARSQYRAPRREEPSGVVVIHTAENAPDTVATDGGAEAVAKFIRNRSDAGSYHSLVDSDSAIRLVPWEWEAFQDGTGSNRHAVGLSVATTAAWWPQAPTAWRNGAVEHLAREAAAYARWLHQRRGIVVPAGRVSRDESELRTPGFISHAERDPGRRSDPGAAFPWGQFLTRYAELSADLGNAPDADLPLATEAPPMLIVRAFNSDHRLLVSNGLVFVAHVPLTGDLAQSTVPVQRVNEDLWKSYVAQAEIRGTLVDPR